MHVLEGGLPAWQAAGGPLDEAPVDEAQFLEPVLRAKQATAPGAYPAKLDASKVRLVLGPALCAAHVREWGRGKMLRCVISLGGALCRVCCG